MKELQIVRFTQPAMASLIPCKLFEQIAEADEAVDMNALIKTAQAQMGSPNTYFFALIDPETQGVAGFLWAVRDGVRNRLIVFWMSVLPEHQGDGVLHTFLGLCKEVCIRQKLDKTIELYSLHPPIPQRYGGAPSKTRIYEFDITDPEYGKERRIEERQVD